MNGHVSEPAVDAMKLSPPRPRSESDLSDLNDVPTAQLYPQDEVNSEHDAIHDMATSEMDEDEDAPGEEDEDYDADTPPTGPSNGMRHDRSLSEESMRPGKRKPDLDVDDEEYMKENPELYGLRRSVRIHGPACHSLTDILPTGPSATYPPSGTCTSSTTHLRLALTI